MPKFEPYFKDVNTQQSIRVTTIQTRDHLKTTTTKLFQYQLKCMFYCLYANNVNVL